MPCDAEVRREPSRSICSFFRISKRFPWAKFIYRCNASLAEKWTRRAVGFRLMIDGAVKSPINLNAHRYMSSSPISTCFYVYKKQALLRLRP